MHAVNADEQDMLNARPAPERVAVLRGSRKLHAENKRGNGPCPECEFHIPPGK
jgi:hypothetical protein